MYEYTDETINTYEQTKKSIRNKNKTPDSNRRSRYNLDEFNAPPRPIREKRSIDLSDITHVGTRVVIGGGIGLLAGVGAIAVAASAGEIIIGGVVTKISGIVGGTLGLSMGVNQVKKRKYSEEFQY